MAKKGENIYKRKDLRWEGRYKKGRRENGTIHYGYIYGKSYLEVKEKLLIEKAKHQSFMAINGEATITYEEWCVKWLTKRQIVLKKSTYASYLYKLKKYVFPYIGQLPLNQVTTETIQNLIQTWLDSQLKPSTIHVNYQILKKPLHEAFLEKKIQQFPCEMILLPKKERKTVRSLTRKEEAIIENQAKKGAPIHALSVLLALKAGLRIGEIAALKWEDVDFKHRLLHVSQTYQRIPLSTESSKSELLLSSAKTTQSVRQIPIGHNLYKWLKKGYRKAVGPYVCSTTQRPNEPRTITYHFHQLLKKTPLETVRFHQLRHTFATRCMESQGNVTAISALLGHASTQMTLDVYTDADLVSLKETILKKEKAKQTA